jgi:ABC-type uncharacterized transport system substrate-binding protein
MARQDILLDSEGNWAVENGDFVVGNSDDQHVEQLLLTRKGMIREAASVGVGILGYLKKQNTQISDLKREIKINLQSDGYKVRKLTIDDKGEFTLDYETTYNE